MKRFRWLLILVLVLVVLFGSSAYYIGTYNNFQVEGEVQLSILEKPVTIYRDDKGMAYVKAENFTDLIKTQGYVTAQDRLFQMHLTRFFAESRLSEFFGEKAKATDIKMRTLGFARLAKEHIKVLNKETLAFLQAYTDGINAFIEKGEDIPLEFSLAGIEPEPWTIESSLAIMYYMGWGSAANMKTEILSQMLIDKIGLERFKEIYPININMDSPNAPEDSLAFWQDLETKEVDTNTTTFSEKELQGLLALNNSEDFQLQFGSNNWVVDGFHSESGKPIMASDPHLDSRMLPGVMHNIGLFSGDIRVVGVTVPGIPGILIGRSQYLSNGITNAYLDCQDLFIEQADPNNAQNYLEGKKSIPFDVIEEVIKIKGEEGMTEEKITIRITNRGVVVNDIIPELETDKLISMSWSAAKVMGENIGLDFFFKAKNVKEAKKYISQITMTVNNFCIADVNGDIAWFTTGRLPKRRAGVGRIPFLVQDSLPTWLGWIPYDSMPQQINSERGWIGNANHKTISADYPFYMSNYFSSSYRYERLIELMESKEKSNVDDHWQYQRDDYNKLAETLCPIFIEELSKNEETKDLAEELKKWDYHQKIESVPATIFQNVYRILPRLIYEDDLGEEMTSEMLGTWYFWQERVEKMVVENQSDWLDDINTTEKKETRIEMIQQAGMQAKEELTALYGNNIQDWQWGKNHQMTYINPIRRSGFGKEFLGTSPIPMGGSGETLYRALYEYNNPTDIGFSACLRMVADMADDEKVLAVINGGTVSRTFHDNHKDQVDVYMSGEKQYWWFSDAKIKENAVYELVLKP